jgi:hypothetical protein
MSSIHFFEKLCAGRLSEVAHLPYKADPEPPVSWPQSRFAHEPSPVNLPFFSAAFWEAVLRCPPAVTVQLRRPEVVDSRGLANGG